MLDLKIRKHQTGNVVHAAVKVPRFQAAEDDLSTCDSVFSIDENVNDLLEKELKDINENE